MRSSLIFSTAIVIAASLLSASCEGGTERDSSTPSVVGNSYRLTADQKSRALAQASDFERTLLADGVLTFEEYEEATFAAIQCMKSSGFGIGPGDGPEVQDKLEGPRLTPRGRYTYNPYSPPNFDRDEFIRIITDCKRRYTDVVDFFWAVKTAPAETELQRMRSEIAACLRAVGHEVPEQPSSLELARVMYPPDGKPQSGLGPAQFYADCARPVADQHGLYGFLG